MARSFKGIWIPAEIWTDKKLSWTEKILLREIDSLDDEDQGGCYASNAYFAEFFQLSKSRVSEIISSLVAKKYVRSMLFKYTDKGQIKTRRLLKVAKKTIRKTEAPPSESRKPPSVSRKGYSGNGEYNNTLDKSNKGAELTPEARSARNRRVTEFFQKMGVPCPNLAKWNNEKIEDSSTTPKKESGIENPNQN